MNVTLRPVEPGDTAFLTALYAESREDELKLVPWTDEQKESFVAHQFNAQNEHYRSKFPEASFDAIVADSESVGRLYVLRNEEQIRILDISVVRARRQQGIGGLLIKQLMEEADATVRPLRIYLEANNPYIAVFTKWGFSRRSSDDGFYWLFERAARAAS